MTRLQTDQRGDSWRPRRKKSAPTHWPANVIERAVRIFTNVRKRGTATWIADCPLCRQHTVTFGIDAKGWIGMKVLCPCDFDAVNQAFVQASCARWPKFQQLVEVAPA